jgi:hypothetical protein
MQPHRAVRRLTRSTLRLVCPKKTP